MDNCWLTNNEWYEQNIEFPIREIVKNLRNQGINTFCSCGHKLFIQCETYDSSSELNIIFNVLVTMKIKKYKVNLEYSWDDSNVHQFLEILLPDKNGHYSQRVCDNPHYIQQEWEK